MSNNEQQLPGNAGADEAVSAAYRSLATERTPEALDRRVLREAARAGRTPYSRAIRWTRPLAWATTAGISLAIMLQMLQTPEPDALPVPAATVPTAPADAAARDVMPAPAAVPVTEAEQQLELREDAARAVTFADESAHDSADVPIRKEAARHQEPVVAEPAEAGSRERSLRLEELARQKTESVTAAPQARLGLTAAHDTAAGVASEVSCSAEARSRGDTWFACIEALREAGLHAIADEEFEALRAAFPEFVPPVTNDR